MMTTLFARAASTAVILCLVASPGVCAPWDAPSSARLTPNLTDQALSPASIGGFTNLDHAAEGAEVRRQANEAELGGSRSLAEAKPREQDSSSGEGGPDLVSQFKNQDPWQALDPKQRLSVDRLLRGFPLKEIPANNPLRKFMNETALGKSGDWRRLFYSAYAANRIITDPPPELLRVIAAWFNQLPDSKKTLIQSLMENYKTPGELARIRGISLSTVQSQLTALNENIREKGRQSFPEWQNDAYLGSMILMWAQRHGRLPDDVHLLLAPKEAHSVDKSSQESHAGDRLHALLQRFAGHVIEALPMGKEFVVAKFVREIGIHQTIFDNFRLHPERRQVPSRDQLVVLSNKLKVAAEDLFPDFDEAVELKKAEIGARRDATRKGGLGRNKTPADSLTQAPEIPLGDQAKTCLWVSIASSDQIRSLFRKYDGHRLADSIILYKEYFRGSSTLDDFRRKAILEFPHHESKIDNVSKAIGETFECENPTMGAQEAGADLFTRVTEIEGTVLLNLLDFSSGGMTIVEIAQLIDSSRKVAEQSILALSEKRLIIKIKGNVTKFRLKSSGRRIARAIKQQRTRSTSGAA